MLKKLKHLVHKEQFYPTWMGMFLNPFYIARRWLFEEIRSLANLVSGRVLDIGCGQKPYSCLFNCDEYIGLEIDTPENKKIKKLICFMMENIFRQQTIHSTGLSPTKFFNMFLTRMNFWQRLTGS